MPRDVPAGGPAQAGEGTVDPHGGGRLPYLDGEPLSEAEAATFRSTVTEAAPFDRLLEQLERAHGIDGVDVEDASVARVSHPDATVERPVLEWVGLRSTVHAFTRSVDADRVRVVAAVGADTDRDEGPVDLAPVPGDVTVRYYADAATVLRGDDLTDQIWVGLHLSGGDQLDAVADHVLQSRARSRQPPRAVIDVATEDPVAGAPVQFSAAGTLAEGPAPIVRYEWIFDADRVDDPLESPDRGAVYEAGDAGQVVHEPLQLRTSHAYESPGTYRAFLIVEDADGNRSMDSVRFQIAEPSGSEAVDLELEIDVETLDSASRRVRFHDRTDVPDDVAIEGRTWVIGTDSYEGGTIEHEFEAAGLHEVSLTVRTERGSRESTRRTVLVGGTEADLPASVDVRASIGRIVRADVDLGRFGAVANVDAPAGEGYAVVSHGPQLAEGGTTLEFTARDSTVPEIHGGVSCGWSVDILTYGLPSTLLNEIAARGNDARGREDPLSPDTDAVPYGDVELVGNPLTEIEWSVLDEPIRDERARTETRLAETMRYELPRSPTRWTIRHPHHEDVLSRRPLFRVRLEVRVEIPDPELEFVPVAVDDEGELSVAVFQVTQATTTVSDSAEMLVYADRRDEDVSADIAVDEPEDARLQSLSRVENHRWASGRPGFAGYTVAGTYDANDRRVTRSNHPVVVPTRTERVDYLAFTGPDLGTPGRYQRVIEDRVDVQWIAFEPLEWGVPDPDRRVFTPVGVRR